MQYGPLAAVLFGISAPLSKLILDGVDPIMLAGGSSILELVHPWDSCSCSGGALELLTEKPVSKGATSRGS